jgi:MFS family permease
MGTDDQPGAGRGKWLALTAALLGWLFDGAEMGVFSMVGRPAIQDLLGTSDDAVIGLWFGVVTAGFLVGAATGGVLFGWLGDRIGRVRAMTLSVLVYSLFTGLCGVTTHAWQMGALRFVAALGMGGEWSLGVALVMEVWPNRSRAFMAGLIGAAGNVGYMLVGFIGLGLAAMLGAVHGRLTALGLAPETADWFVRHQGWRLMMMVGALPALLTFLIRLFVPESEKWRQEKGRGHTSGWATQDLLGVVVGATGPALMIYLWAWDQPAWLHSLPVRLAGSVLGLIVAAVGYTYPLARYLRRQPASATADHAPARVLRRLLLAACLSGVALLGTWCSVQWAPSWADKLASGEGHAKEYTQIALAVGAVVGTIVAAFMGDWFGRRPAYALLCVLSLGSVYLLFQTNTAYGRTFLVSAAVAGGATASFYGWLPLYLPELFPTRVRATGQGFGYNFGRILAGVGALQTGNLMGLFQHDVTLGGLTFTKGYPLACTAMSLIYVVGVAIIWLAPETRGQPLPE